MTDEDWKVVRTVNGPGDWALTNISGKQARRVQVTFEGEIGGRRWTEGITPARVATRPGEIGPYETVTVNIPEPNTVDRVTVEWDGVFRRKTWTTSA
ncbi:hypothetical protein [Kribbella swartbergensis]